MLTAALHGPLAGHLTARTPNAGLHVAAVLRGGRGEDEVLQAAAAHGIATAGLSECFRASPAKSGLMLGFGAVSAPGLPAALRTLGRICRPNLRPDNIRYAPMTRQQWSLDVNADRRG